MPITHEQATAIYMAIQRTSRSTLKEELIDCAVRYAQLRVDWVLADVSRRQDLEEARTRSHNALIDWCNILAREMNKAGEDTMWRVDLGDDRRCIGDLACYLHCFLGLDAR